MRKILDRLYDISLGLAALFLLAIAVMVLGQVGSNILNNIIKFTTGVAGDFTIPSYAEFAGFFLAASSFLALAGTFRSGSHIRVTLVLQCLSPRIRRPLEGIVVFLAFILAAYMFWYLALLMLESYEYNDMSPGIIPVALWIPQLSLVLGTGVFAISLLDSFVAIIRGAEMAHPESSELE